MNLFDDRWRGTWKKQIKLATRCNVNEQDGKNNAEMQTKWTKMTWKTFERLLDEVETGLFKA